MAIELLPEFLHLLGGLVEHILVDSEGSIAVSDQPFDCALQSCDDLGQLAHLLVDCFARIARVVVATVVVLLVSGVLGRILLPESAGDSQDFLLRGFHGWQLIY